MHSSLPGIGPVVVYTQAPDTRFLNKNYYYCLTQRNPCKKSIHEHSIAAEFKLILLPLLSISLLFLPFLQATDYKYCDNEGNYVVKIDGVDISPNPVVRGKPATFTISASTETGIPIHSFFLAVRVRQKFPLAAFGGGCFPKVYGGRQEIYMASEIRCSGSNLKSC
ncbi:hypothetical protein CRYUN_Cryun02cG0161000 [Craigia yunnanensis]